MLFEGDDERATRSLLSVLAWAAADLVLATSERALFELLAEALSWQGLRAVILVPDGEALWAQHVRGTPPSGSSPETSLSVGARLERDQAVALLTRLGEGAGPSRLPWNEALPAHEATSWIGTRIDAREGLRAVVIVEGASFSSSAAEVLAQLGRFVGALSSRLQPQGLHEGSSATPSLIAQERLSVLGEAAAVLAHEMRNPLGALANAVALLRRAPRPDQQIPIDIITDEVTRLETLVRDLLHLARPLEPVRTQLELGALARSTLERMERSLPRGEVALRLIPWHSKLLVRADPKLLTLALENLVRNASQAAPPRTEVRVIVSHRTTRASIAVEDDGLGIPPDATPRLFEPFFTTRAVGTGLGLPIVKRVVEAHGGSVEVGRSASGGARFELLLALT